jgi:hypothetical protein
MKKGSDMGLTRIRVREVDISIALENDGLYFEEGKNCQSGYCGVGREGFNADLREAWALWDDV